MRKRGRTFFTDERAARFPHEIPDEQKVRQGPIFPDNKFPDDWKQHADEPWRVLFPDLDWTPPDRDL